MATSRPILANQLPVLINIKVKGAERVIARMRQIMANLPKETDEGSLTLMRKAQQIAKQEIRTKTSGTGALAEGIIIKKEETQQGNNRITTKWRLDVDPVVARYAGAVNDGFVGHWVHKDMLGAWLALHPEVKLRYGKWLEVGYPKRDTTGNSAPWLQEGGVKFMQKAYAEVLKLTLEEYQRRITKALKR